MKIFKTLILTFLSISLLLCQETDHKKMFDPNSNYLDYGQYDTIFENAAKVNSSFRNTINNYKLVPYRTVAVNPKDILTGSILFIPQAVGIRLPNGTYHDGYFLAHDTLDLSTSNTIKFYFEYKSDNNCIPEKINVYVVRGVMESTINNQYKLQYRWKKQRQTHEMVWKDLENLMKEAKSKYPDLNKRIQYISERGLGTPYVIFNLGEGPDAKCDPDPLMNFSQTDCMTFCEHMIAMSISDSYKDMFKNLQRIRYKDSKIGMTTRNHYTIADWLPNNDWILYDATELIGGKLYNEMTKTIDRKKDFKNLPVDQEKLVKVSNRQTVKIKYIPEENLLSIADNLHGGEIVSIISNKPGIFSAHMGIIVRDEWDNLIFRHGSSLEKTAQVIDQRFEEIVDSLKKSNSRVGMVFMRLKEN